MCVVPDLIAQVGPDTRGTESLLCFGCPFTVLDTFAKIECLEVLMIRNNTDFSIRSVRFLCIDEFDGSVCRCIAHDYNEGERYPILRLLYLFECMSQPDLYGLKTLAIFGFDGLQEVLEQDWSLEFIWEIRFSRGSPRRDL